MSLSVVTIPQKMSGTGTILDCESQHFNRDITYPSGKKFAVVKAAYYLDDDYIFFDDLNAACEFARYDTSIREFKTWIIDVNSNVFDTCGDFVYRLDA